jgi:hypothetical protein
MNLTNKLFMTGVVISALMPVFQAHAQYRPTGEDGITASPRLRQMLSERPALDRYGSTSSDPVLVSGSTRDGIVAPSKSNPQLTQRKGNITLPTSTASALASTTKAPNDGIAASPKLRQQMREQPVRSEVQLAPITPAK